MHKLTCEVKTTKMKKKKPASKFPCEPFSFFPSLFSLFKLQHLTLYLTLLIN